MPNWCYTDYKVTGNKDEVESLYNIMKELEDSKDSLVENSFGNRWLGNLVTKLGEDWNKISCRGEWDNLTYYGGGYFGFSVESAWCEPKEVRELIERKFPNIKLYYLSEEDGMCIFETNDSKGEFFVDMYKLWTEENGTDYFSTLQELINTVTKITGFIDIKIFYDCEKALDLENIDYSLNEINIV